MALSNDKLERLLREFQHASIPIGSPGFDLHPSFMAAERRNPQYLFNYSRYVHWREFDAAYLSRAEAAVRIAADEVQRGLLRQNLHGACIVTSMILQRILDRHGVWSCMVKGSLHACKPDGSLLFGIWPLDQAAPQGKENGHVWLYAPPFHVVDVTLNLQGEDASVTSLLPDKVLANDVKAVAGVRLEELISPKMLRRMEQEGYTPQFVVNRAMPAYAQEIARDFGSVVVRHDHGSLKYITTGFGGADDVLEKINGYSVDGMSAFNFYLSDIKPKLDALGVIPGAGR